MGEESAAGLGPESKREVGTPGGCGWSALPGAGDGLRTEPGLLQAWMVALEPAELGDSEPPGATTEALETGGSRAPRAE